ncbi:MAG TPA: thiamine pyrophosphate-dependent enzyme, partial [Acidimicrobiia bacterium]
RLFGLLGDSTIGMATVAAESGIEYVSSRHEGGAISLAAGYSFATNAPAVTTVSTGPGLTNAITALRAAVDLRLAVVVIVATAPADGRLNRQRIPHRGYVELVGAGWHSITDHAEIQPGMQQAWHRAASEHRPQVVEVSYEVMHSPGESGPPTQAPPEITEPEIVGEVEAAVDLLVGSSRPVIVAGLGAVFSDAEPELLALARSAGALLATTLRARGLFADDEFCIGLAGGFSSPVTHSLIRESDLILSFGAALNHHTTDNDRLFEGIPTVQVDCDPVALGRWFDTGVRIQGDAKVVARTLVEALEMTEETSRERYRTESVRERIVSFDLGSSIVDSSSVDGLDPRIVLMQLDQILPPHRMTITDTAHQIEWPSRYLSVRKPNTYLSCVGAGAVGNSLGTSIGAALGTDLLTVCVLGDGALMMSLAELDTSVRAGANLLVVVMNDSAFGAEVHKVRKLGLTDRLAVFPPVNFAGVMSALGGRGIRLNQPSDVDQVPALLGAGPVLVDVPITRDVVGQRLQ